MTESIDARPWERLSDLIAAGHAQEVQDFIGRLTPAETALAVSRLEEEQRVALLSLLSAEEVADMLVELPEEQAADLIEEIPAQAAADIVIRMLPSEQADLLQDVDPEEAEAILQAMATEDAERTRDLMQYPPDTAGGLMTLRYLAFNESRTIKDVVANLRDHADTYSDYEVQYAYVIARDGRLLGVLHMRDLLLAPGAAAIADRMISEPVHVNTNTSLDELIGLFEEHASFIGIPVTDARGRLVGVVRRAAVLEAEGERTESSFLKISGIVGGEEYRSMPLFIRSFRRLSWLAPNIVLNMIAASIIALYQDTLQAAIALAVFLPIISDMSGCSGNQAVAVSIRELSLGLIRPTEFVRVFAKETWLGVLNGALLGILLGSVAVLWKGNVVLGLVVGSALMLNTLLSVLLGGSVPLVLKRLGVDPALASGPILTTVTDMCGFFFVLSFASTMLPRL